MPTTVIEDWGDAILAATSTALTTLLNAIPAILGALLILAIGWILSNILGGLVRRLLGGAGADRMFAQHAGDIYGQRAATIQPSRVGGELVKWLIRIVFVVAAANALNLPQVSLLLNQVLLWIPNLIVAVVILMVAPLVARFVRGTIEVGAGQLGFTNAPLLGRIAEIAIVAFAVVVAVNQIGIAANLVNTIFIGLVAALALGFGLAFGLGGRDVAGEITRSWYESTRQTAERVRSRAGAVAQQTSAATRSREARVETAASMTRSTDV
jgi:hypothetical protein